MTRALDGAALSRFSDAFAGEVVLPGDGGYNAARAVWNGMVDRHPELVVRPIDAAGVARAIRFAREQELVIAVRSGGHSIPGFSTCDGGIVIDLSRMHGVHVDRERRLAYVNGGALLGELDDAAQAAGLVCPVGVVSHTGVAGLTLGGGMGRLQRKYGLTIDNLAAVDLVTADGSAVRASEDENPDLFWGLRGAGANFGVATSFEFRLHPQQPVITHGSVIHPVARALDLAAVYRDIVEEGPDEVWLGFYVELALPADAFPADVAGQPIARVSVMHCGSPEAAERDLSALRSIGPPVVDSIAPKPYLDTQHLADEAMDWGRRFYMKSAFLRSLGDDLVDHFVAQIGRIPDETDCDFSVWSCGRAIARVAEGDTAFTGREAAFWLAAEATWDDPQLDDAARAWARAAMEDLPRTSAGRYVNDVADVEEGGARSVYGDAKYERLVAVKRAWDADNVFRLNQNVRP
jgi:FAD/FMN-containing dehydrogenase